MATQSDASVRAQVVRRVRTAMGTGLYAVGNLFGSRKACLLGLRGASERALARRDLTEAERLAADLVQLAAVFPRDWYYGNAIHHGHELLGRVHLERGDLGDAERELLEAGRTPGSPQLCSFGPSFRLARDLLLEGRRGAVLEYIELCRRFWCPEGARSESATVNRARLVRWTEEIRDGKVPDFGPNLIY